MITFPTCILQYSIAIYKHAFVKSILRINKHYVVTDKRSYGNSKYFLFQPYYIQCDRFALWKNIPLPRSIVVQTTSTVYHSTIENIQFICEICNPDFWRSPGKSSGCAYPPRALSRWGFCWEHGLPPDCLTRGGSTLRRSCSVSGRLEIIDVD